MKEKHSIAFQSNYLITGKEPPIIAANEQIASSSQKDISSGIMTLHSILITQKEECLKLIDEKTVQRLISLVANEETDIQIKKQILEFISNLCQVDKSFTHLFWYYDFQKVLIDIISNDNPPVPLNEPIEILSEMANFTKIAFKILINDFKLLNILLRKLTLNLSIPDQYGVLNGLSSLLGSKCVKPIELYIEIIKGISYHIEHSNLIDQILGKAFQVLGKAIDITEEDIEELENDPILDNFDFHPLCQFSVQILKEKRNETKIEIINFMKFIIYRNDEFVNFFLELNIFDVFHEICRMASEDLIIQALIIVSMCLLSSEKAISSLSSSKFLSDAGHFLHYGTKKIKADALRLFNNIISIRNKFFNLEFAKEIIEKFDVLDVLADFLRLDDSSFVSIHILYYCLDTIYSAINIYSKTGCEMPSPPIQMIIDDMNYEELLRLSELNKSSDIDEMNQEDLLRLIDLANLIKVEVQPFIKNA